MKQKWMRMFSFIICIMFLCSYSMMACVTTVNAATKGSGDDAVEADANNTGDSNAEGDSEEQNSDAVSGSDSDIVFSGCKVTGNEVGKNVTIQFTVSTSNAKKYNVTGIEKIYPVVDSSFPFETTDEAYKVIRGNGAASVNCTYTLKARSSIATGDYPVAFQILYNRKSTDAKKKDTYIDNDYMVTKNINVNLNAKKKATTEQPAAEDDDITIKVPKTPSGIYSQTCKVDFSVQSKKSKIISVTPVISSDFPFETKGDAYKSCDAKKAKSVNCSYAFTVKKDITTGYHGVSFSILYEKNGKKFTTTRIINASLTAKKKANENKEGGKTSTPRLMVTGYTTDIDKVMPNKTFKLNLLVKNNSKSTVNNIKYTLSSEDGDFIPVSGASTAYISSLAAGGQQTLSFDMKAAPGLTAKSYVIKVKSEYENAKADAFTAEDDISIPVYLKDQISITDLVPPDMVAIGGTADLSFSINNQGAGSISNVNVKCEGPGFDAQESYVGNISAGSTGYATVTLNGNEQADGSKESTITITFENASGETKTMTEKTNIMVDEEIVDDEGDVNEEGTEDVAKTNPVKLILTLVIAGLVVVTIITIVIRKKRKLKKMKEEEELMDDDI